MPGGTASIWPRDGLAMTRQLPEPPQLFARFDSDNTSDGAARERFEQFVTDLIAVQWNDATTVAANNHNDWGIDTFVGDLGGGSVQVWQSKYVLEWQDKSPRAKCGSRLLRQPQRRKRRSIASQNGLSWCRQSFTRIR